MSLIAAIDGAERRSIHPRDPALVELFGGGSRSYAGVSVTPLRAMGVMGVQAAVRLISETIGSLPFGMFKSLEPRGRERAKSHPLQHLLADQPNEFQTAMEFFEMSQAHNLLRGFSCARIVETAGGNIEQLIPLHPDRVRPRYERLPGATTGKKVRFFAHDQTDGGPTEILLPHEVLYVPGISDDGITPLSPIQLARETVGLALAGEEHGARHLANNVQAGVVLEHPNHMEDDAFKRFKADWEAFHAGVRRAGKTVMLEDGMKMNQLTLTNKDAQFIEMRKFQLREIARWFKVPPHMIGDLEQATFSNIEHQAIEFVVHTMLPWLVRWEKRIKTTLLGPTEQKTLFPKFIVDGLLRGDAKSRYEAYAIARNWGWLSADDVRELEDMNPLPDGQGEVYLTPMNMIPANEASLQPSPAPAPGLPAPVPAPAPIPEPVADPDGRAQRLAQLRGRIELAHVRLFLDGVNRALRKEIEAGKRAIAKSRTAGTPAAITKWADEFYTDHGELVQRVFEPIMATTADAIASAMAAGLGLEDDDFRSLQLAALANGLAQNTGRRHAERQRAEVQGVLTSTDARQIPDAIERLMAQWGSRTADMAATELDLVSASVQAAVYGKAGLLPSRTRPHVLPART